MAWNSAAIATVSSSAHRDVADAELERLEERMRPDVPPDLLGVVDAVGPDQQVDELFVLAQLGIESGMLVRGNLSKTLQR